jgi:hypothetical protein
MRRKWLFIIPAAIIAIPLFMFIGGEVVLRLWNWLLPPLFGWRLITFWQALGILLLCRVLFGGHGWRGSRGSRFRHRMRERCGRMTPEERERFRQAMRERWGFATASGQSKAE